LNCFCWQIPKPFTARSNKIQWRNSKGSKNNYEISSVSFGVFNGLSTEGASHVTLGVGASCVYVCVWGGGCSGGS
jgi:hypothetical protein